MKVQRIDHVGINVEDLSAAKEFFLALGFKVLGEMDVEGEWVGRVIDLKNVRDTLVMLGTPGGEATIELIQFHSPKDANGIQKSSSNTLGIRHICLAVDDAEEAVAIATKHGGVLMGDIHNYENVFKVCYVRGPEGIIVEMAEKLS